jgi:hypothetical protein
MNGDVRGQPGSALALAGSRTRSTAYEKAQAQKCVAAKKTGSHAAIQDSFGAEVNRRTAKEKRLLDNRRGASI